MVFAGESHMDMIAKELSLDPAELRRRNMLKDGDLLANGHHLEHVRATETLEAALKASGGLAAPQWIGRGVAMTHRHIGVGFTNARVRLEAKGNVVLSTALPDTGTGAPLVLRQIVAEVLDLTLDEVDIELANTDDFTTDSGVGGSRVTHTGGRAAYHAAEAQGADPGGGEEARDPGGLVGGRGASRRARGPNAGGVALLRGEVSQRGHVLHGPGRRGRGRPADGPGDGAPLHDRA